MSDPRPCGCVRPASCHLCDSRRKDPATKLELRMPISMSLDDRSKLDTITERMGTPSRSETVRKLIQDRHADLDLLGLMKDSDV